MQVLRWFFKDSFKDSQRFIKDLIKNLQRPFLRIIAESALIREDLERASMIIVDSLRILQRIFEKSNFFLVGKLNNRDYSFALLISQPRFQLKSVTTFESHSVLLDLTTHTTAFIQLSIFLGTYRLHIYSKFAFKTSEQFWVSIHLWFFDQRIFKDLWWIFKDLLRIFNWSLKILRRT